MIEINHIVAGDRSRHGKTDELDAYRAATAAAARTQTGVVKHFHPAIAAVRVLLVARDHHKSSRQRVWGRITAILVNCPEPLRREVAGLTRAEKLDLFYRWRPDQTRVDDLVQATKIVLRDLAKEHLPN